MLPQNVLLALTTTVGVWYVALPLTATIYYSRISGMKVRVKRVCFTRFRPCLRQVTVKSPDDGTELVHMEQVINGGPGNVDGTAFNTHFSVLFGARDLRATSWDVVRAALWAPRIAFQGKVSVSLILDGEHGEVFKKIVELDAQHIEVLRGGTVGTVTFVQNLTADALRQDVRSLPKEIRKAAQRLIEERIAQKAERVRKTTVGIIGDLREATRSVDAALDGVPGMLHEYARQADSFLGKVSLWLGENEYGNESMKLGHNPNEPKGLRTPTSGFPEHD